MLSFARRRLTFANVAMTVALVFAMSGGAFAAGKFLITSTKQISPKVLKQLKGAKGSTGATGPQGPAGPAGPSGPQGPAGKEGAAGANGKDGVSVTGAAASNVECPQGGVKYTSASGSNPVCNGQNGQTGFTATLPHGKTEKGAWGAAGVPAGFGFGGSGIFASISFVIPLVSAPAPVVIGQEEGEGEAKQSPAIPGECTGNAVNPGAVAGKLCIFVSSSPLFVQNLGAIAATEPGVGKGGEAGTTGSVLYLVANPAEGEKPMAASGTWAVTAE